MVINERLSWKSETVCCFTSEGVKNLAGSTGAAGFEDAGLSFGKYISNIFETQNAIAAVPIRPAALISPALM